MKALRIFILVGLCGVGVVLLMFDRQPDSRDPVLAGETVGQRELAAESTEPSPALSRRPLSRAAGEPEAGAQVEKPDMLDGLNDPQGAIERDLAIVDNLLFSYYSVFQEFPYGENADWVRVFRGANNRGIAFIATEGDWMNAAGEIVDRWDTPFYFHRMSGRQIEIRSAGPDGVHWTDDDFSSLEPDSDLAASLLMATETSVAQ